jgi:hypothetical protein
VGNVVDPVSIVPDLKYLADPRTNSITGGPNTVTLKKNGKTGALISITHPPTSNELNLLISVGYSDDNLPYYLTSKQDERGNVTECHRDGRNRIWHVNYPSHGVEEFT